uniref:ZAD domain-containing protein n=1 Tax=Anopheles maculatus TaxID=74869 RepID=A0A182T895_9DIPT
MSHQTCVSCNVKNSGMIAIYQHPNGLDEMFRTVTDVEVQSEDHLCVPCYDDMKIAYRFKQKCRQNVALRTTQQTQKRTQPPASSELSVNSTTDVSTTVSEPSSSKDAISKEDSIKETEASSLVQQKVELILDNETLQDDADISFEIVEQEPEDAAH